MSPDAAEADVEDEAGTILKDGAGDHADDQIEPTPDTTAAADADALWERYESQRNAM